MGKKAKKKAAPNCLDYVTRFGKPDIQRLGVFIEMPYLGAQLRKKPKWQPENINFLGGCNKIKAGNDDGYFGPFQRLFIGEALKGRGRKPKKSKFEPVSNLPLMPPKGHIYRSGPGDYYGCFSKHEYFSSKEKKPKKKKEGEVTPVYKNLYTSPGKKGNCGYLDITIGKYPGYEEPSKRKRKVYEYGAVLNGPFVLGHYTQDYFYENPYYDPKPKPGRVYIKPPPVIPPIVIDPPYITIPGPGKVMGGCKAGGFEKWPEYISNRIIRKGKPPKPSDAWVDGPMYPPSRFTKTIQYSSIVSCNIDFRLSGDNYESFEPVYTKYLERKQ